MGRIAGSASAEVDAPLDEVWAVVADVESAPDWQGGLNDLEALERDESGRPTLVETETDAKVKAVKALVRFRYEGPTRLSWTQENLGDGRTRATYAIDADPGRVLGMLIRGPVEGVVRDMLVNARPGELKAHVEGG
jgi:hypothetical protein